MNQTTNKPFKLRLANTYPWIVWLLASSFLFYKYLLQVSPSIMVNQLMQTFSLDGLQLGNLAAFYFYAYLAMQIPVGLLLDHFNPKRMITGAIIVCAFGALCFGLAHSFWLACFGRLLIGLGGSFSAVGTMKLISLWFPPRRFALVSGLMMTAGMLGAAGGEAPLAYVINHAGWRQSMIYCAIIGFILAAIIFIFIKDKAQESAETTAHESLTSTIIQHLKDIMRDKRSWIISLYSGLAFMPISAFAGLWGVPYLMEKYHSSHVATAAMISLVFFGFALGSPLAGWLSDKIKRRKPIMMYGTLLSTACLSATLYYPSTNVELLKALLFGFGFFSGFFFVSFAYMREIHAASLGGTAIGFINMFNASCGALSEPLIGKLLDNGWAHTMAHGVRTFSISNYHHALLVLPIATLFSIVLVFFIPETHCQPKANS